MTWFQLGGTDVQVAYLHANYKCHARNVTCLQDFLLKQPVRKEVPQQQTLSPCQP